MTIVNMPKRTSTSDVIREIIERQILDGVLKPGEKVNQLALSHALDVSMTIVREALMSLETDGLVYNIHRKGIYIADFSANDIRDLFVVRKHMEHLVSDLVIQKARDDQLQVLETLLVDMEKQKNRRDFEKYWALDVQFHNYILLVAANDHLTKFVDSLAKKIRLLRYKVITKGERLEQSYAYHRDLVKCFRARDISAAGRLVIDNLDRVEKILIEEMESGESPQ